MTLADCITLLLKSKKLRDLVEVAKSVGRTTATKAEAKEAWEALRGHLAANDHRPAVATALALLWLDPDASVGYLRNNSFLRASKYRYRTACIKKVVGAALEIAEELSLSQERRVYLSSILALADTASGAKQVYDSLVQRLHAHHTVGLKTLMAMVNTAFATDHPGERAADSNSLAYWSATEQASALSRLYMITRDELGIRIWGSVDDMAVEKHHALYAGLLIDAAKLNEFIDAEVMIDGLPYKAERTTEAVSISSIDPTFERSVRLGYIQTDLQMSGRVAIHAEQLRRSGIELIPFSELVVRVGDALGRFVHLRTIPQSRLVIELPEVPPVIAMLNLDQPYLEESCLMFGACLDYFHTPEMGELKVSDKLTAMDLFKVQRIFKLIDQMFRVKLESFADHGERRMLMLRSTVMVIKRVELAKWLRFVLSDDKVEELISLLLLPAKHQVKGSPEYIDIQYRPLLPSKDVYIAAAPALLARSNLIRSVINASKIRKALVGKEDPMQAAVVLALRNAGFLAEGSVDFNINGNRETDIFCYRDGVLFVFECKNAYHPCSPQELRGSYDLIVKAEDQLDIRAGWLADATNQSRLFASLSWDVPATARVYTCCITANRLFTGYQMGAHPVRQAREFINVVSNGSIQIVGHDDLERRFWRGNEFHAEDLVDYLEGKTVVQAQLDALIPWFRAFNFNGRTLVFEGCVMNMEQSVRIVDERFRVVPADNDATGAESTEQPPEPPVPVAA